MTHDFGFFKTTMPESRKADFHLGCLDSCIFMDFNYTSDRLISLKRISFDGYGCCVLPDNANVLNSELSTNFTDELNKDKIDQDTLTPIILKLIAINKEYISKDALDEYNVLVKLECPPDHK
jgi:hypothetical protein